MAITQNAINNRTQELTIDPQTTDDSFIQFDTNDVNRFRIGLDDDAADAFKISQGSALGVNDTFVMTTAGERTMPLQPAFLNSVNAEANAFGNTTHSIGTITATTSIIDQGSDMTEGDGAGTPATFTAPITAVYMFNYLLQVDYAATGGNFFWLWISTSNRYYIGPSFPSENRIANFYGVNNDLGLSISALADMDAADTATFLIWEALGAADSNDVIDGYLSGYLAV